MKIVLFMKTNSMKTNCSPQEWDEADDEPYGEESH